MFWVLKNFKKIIKNLLTIGSESDIMYKLPPIRQRTSSLKIEQYEERINITLSIPRLRTHGVSASLRVWGKIEGEKEINSGETKINVSFSKVRLTLSVSMGQVMARL